MEEPDVSKEGEASEKDTVLTVDISNYLDFVKKKKDLISGINNTSIKKGVCNYRLKVIDLKISRRDLEDMGKSELMMMHKPFGDNYEKAATQLDTLRDAEKLLFKRLKISRFGEWRFWQLIVHPTLFWSYVEESSSYLENIYNTINCEFGEYHYEILKNVSNVSFSTFQIAKTVNVKFR